MTVIREWCRVQQTATLAKHPGLRTLLTRAEDLRAPVVGLVCFVVLLVVQLTTSHGDAGMFAEAGDRLVRGHADVFRNSVLQVGPLYLLLVGPGALLSDAVGVPQWAGAAVMTSAASAVLLVAALSALAGTSPRGGRQVLAGLTVLLGGAMVIPATYGHPEEVMTALLLVLATATARRGGTWAPALLLAAAITIKLWAVVGLGLLLVAAGRRLAVQRGAVLAMAIGAAYLPFAVLDRIATFDMQWQVERPAPLSLLLADGSTFGYRQRLLQVVVAGAVGALLARKVRVADVVWALPLGVMSLRLLLDPLSNPYYWTTLVVVVLLRLLMREGPLLESVLLAYLGNIAMLLVIVTAQGWLGAAALAGLGLGALVLALRAATPLRVPPQVPADTS
ncbi:MAG: hypothetical protein JWM40_1600 [Frankiales bacterium]|nr:hypothetical protein [Frankiales bacterium]